MDELVDILDADGKATGKTALKSEAHCNGWFHPTVHIWYYTKEGLVLLQQRGLQKKTYPGHWDVSVAGHVGAGEAILDAAIRESKEEIGVQSSPGDLRKIGVYKAVHRHGDALTDSEFHHTFISELKVPLTALQKQVNEVAKLELVPITTFLETIKKDITTRNYVPHGETYYCSVMASIIKQL